ncbi:MAG: sensor histidine kinase [Gemmatimonadota bacterium]
MGTIRRRLTVWYTVALGLTVLAFGGALYLKRRQLSYQELDNRLVLEAEFASRWLAQSSAVLGRVGNGDPTRPALDPGVAAYFENVRDFLLVADRTGKHLLFASDPARALSYGDLEQLSLPIRIPSPVERSGTLVLAGSARPVRYFARPVTDAGPEVGAVLVGTYTGAVAFGPTDLLQVMLAVAPLILVGSLALGYWLAGTALRPVQGMIDELEAITDGRSLHRRLAVPVSGDEMTRLAVTVNGMLARLEQSFVSLRRFTADASHELKTPLMVLRAGVERALTHPGTPPEIMGALDETLDQISQMAEMVDSLLTLARADEGRAPLAVEASDMRELCAEVAETAEMLGEGHGIVVHNQLPAEPVPLAVDRSRIRQMLLNLVTNAINYTPAGGMVGIELTDHGDRVVVVVRDTGIGIAPGDLPHIFDRFWRADPARSRTGERPGTGLGLAITKWIAEAHGGSIAVQSRPGRGSVFTVTLPRAPQDQGERFGVRGPDRP